MTASEVLSRTAKAASKGSLFIGRRLFGRKPIAAYVSGYLGFNNLGDEALYSATKQIFNHLDILHYDSSRTLRTLCATMPLFRAGIFAGGTLINRLPCYYDEANAFLTEFKNLYFFGTGVADHVFWEGRTGFHHLRSKWSDLLNRCGSVGVRGPMSAGALVDAGVEGVEIVGDPAIALAGADINTEYAENSIGLNLGLMTGGGMWGDDEDKLCSEFLKLAKLLKAANWRVKWFVVRPEDVAITREIACKSETNESIHEIFHCTLSYMEQVRKLGVFVGMKLHATALATCAYVPSVMLEYQPKCLDYMASIAQERQTIRTDHFRAEDVWEMVKLLQAEREARAAELFANIQRLKKVQFTRANEITEEILALH